MRFFKSTTDISFNVFKLIFISFSSFKVLKSTADISSNVLQSTAELSGDVFKSTAELSSEVF